MDELLTVDEVAAYLRVSRSTVWRWCQSKKVPAFKIGREWRISWPVLEEIVESQQKAAVAAELETGPPGLPAANGAGVEEPGYLARGTVGSANGD